MKKLPYGISDYERIMENDYYYVDKTKYIEHLENLAEPYLMFLRPRKFGKTLFTSTLENYYDIAKKDKFEKLYGETYIGKNPTKLRNSYYILRFNFSGIDTTDFESTIRGFKSKVIESIKSFAQKYQLDFFVNEEQDSESILNSLIHAFRLQKNEEKIYVIIDEYDHFANELLSFQTEKFKELVTKNGRIRKWYEILKEGTESVVDRIFITGVSPITLDSLTSGFNICSDKTMDEEFNEMLGFTKQELLDIMDFQTIGKIEQEKLMPILKENYNGYKFSIYGKEKVYNSNMCLYLLSNYIRLKRIPEKLVDMNIASDYSKLGKMLDLCKSDSRLQVLEKTVSGEGIITEITEKFNPEIDFQEEEFVSILFYLGYLTIINNGGEYAILGIPNKVMKDIYSQYFLNTVAQELNVESKIKYALIWKEISSEGKIDLVIEILKKYLKNLSNRDYIKFNEKYIKLVVYCIVMNIKDYLVQSEIETNRNYIDLLITPRDKTKGYKSVMIEFKYLKKEEENLLEKKKQEAKEQIERYADTEAIKCIDGLNKYTVVAVNDQVYVDKID